MALTRSLLKGMGLTDEQSEGVIEAHSDTVNGLKSQISDLQERVKTFDDLQKELNDLKASGSNEFEEKYNNEHEAFEAYKQEIEKEKLSAKKSAALDDLLNESEITARDSVRSLIKKSYDLNAIDFDENGAVKDRESLINGIKSDFKDFIGNVETQGAPANNPPSGSSSKPLTREDIEKMSVEEINKNWEAVSAALNNH